MSFAWKSQDHTLEFDFGNSNFPHRKAQQNRAPPLKILMSSARPLVTCRSSWTNSWRSLFKSCWEGAELGNLRCSQLKSFLLWCVKQVWSREWDSGKNALAMIQWYVIYIIQRIPMSIIIQEDIIQYQDLEMSPTRKTTTNPKGFTLDFGLFLVSWSGTAPDKGWFMMILLVSWCFSGLQQIEKTWMLSRLHNFLAVLFVFQCLGFQPGCFTPTFQEWFHFGFFIEIELNNLSGFCLVWFLVRKLLNLKPKQEIKVNKQTKTKQEIEIA